VKSSRPTATSSGDPKRKRDDSSGSDRGKVPRVNKDTKSTSSVAAGTSTPRSTGLSHPPSTGPAGLPRPPMPGSGRPAMMNNGQPLVRKKKTNADDMFMKRK